MSGRRVYRISLVGFRGYTGKPSRMYEKGRLAKGNALLLWDSNFPLLSHFVPTCPKFTVRRIWISPKLPENRDSRPILSHSVPPTLSVLFSGDLTAMPQAEKWHGNSGQKAYEYIVRRRHEAWQVATVITISKRDCPGQEVRVPNQVVKSVDDWAWIIAKAEMAAAPALSHPILQSPHCGLYAAPQPRETDVSP